MKTKSQNHKGHSGTELQSRPELLNTQLPDFVKHRANRELPTQRVLDYLRAQLPQQYELAEIVGRWIWLEFSPASHRVAANTLWRLGFHWNQRRCVWQHPCGAFAPYEPHPFDPRIKYGSYFAADLKPV